MSVCVKMCGRSHTCIYSKISVMILSLYPNHDDGFDVSFRLAKPCFKNIPLILFADCAPAPTRAPKC